jgi:GTPase
MKATVFVKEVYNITGIGPVPVVEIRQGVLKENMELHVKNRTMTIATMEMNKMKVKEASSGSVGLSLRGGNYTVLKELKGQEVIFSDEKIQTHVTLKSRPNKAKGAFSFITDLFKR